ESGGEPRTAEARRDVSPSDETGRATGEPRSSQAAAGARPGGRYRPSRSRRSSLCAPVRRIAGHRADRRPRAGRCPRRSGGDRARRVQRRSGGQRRPVVAAHPRSVPERAPDGHHPRRAAAQGIPLRRPDAAFVRGAVMSRRPGARFVFPAAVAVILCGAAASVLAQLVVFDPSTYAEAVQAFLQLQRQYQQLIQPYELMAEQARRAPGDLDARYRSLATPWFNLSAPDTYGTTSGWVHSANNGWDVPAGYRAATEPLQAYGGGFDALSAVEAARIRTAYGSVELG